MTSRIQFDSYPYDTASVVPLCQRIFDVILGLIQLTSGEKCEV